MLIHPAVEEGFGMVVLESIKHGVPVAITSAVGAKDVLNDDDYVLIQGTTSNSSKVSFSTVNAAGTFYTDIDLTIESSELNLNGDEICVSRAWKAIQMTPFIERMKSKGVKTE